MGGSGAGGAGRTGGAGASGAGASGGAGGAGAGGAAMCVPIPASFGSACRDCVTTMCAPQMAACFGAGWQTGDVRGAVCEQFAGCWCGCAEGDSACAAACGQAAAQSCTGCLRDATACLRGCDSVCGSGGSGGRPGPGCGAGTGGGAGGSDGGTMPSRSIECNQSSTGAWSCTCTEEGRVVAMCETTDPNPCSFPSCCPFAP